jgi:hypothetical protein
MLGSLIGVPKLPKWHRVASKSFEDDEARQAFISEKSEDSFTLVRKGPRYLLPFLALSNIVTLILAAYLVYTIRQEPPRGRTGLNTLLKETSYFCRFSAFLFRC